MIINGVAISRLECLKPMDTISQIELERISRYYKMVNLSKNISELTWRNGVLCFIKQIVDDYYEIPLKRRSTYQILHLIDKHLLVLDKKLFQSKSHYYTVLAVISDKLIQMLRQETPSMPLYYLLEKINACIEELEMQLSM